MKITVQRFRDARGWGLRVWRSWTSGIIEFEWRVATREASMTDQHAWDDYHGGQRWLAPHCPDCGAEREQDCCRDAADAERYAEHCAALRRAAHEHAHLRRRYGYTRSEWLAASQLTGADWARELPDREIAAVGELVWGTLGARGGV